MMRVRSTIVLLSIGLLLATFASSTISGALNLVQANRSVSGTLVAGDIPIPLTTGLSGAQGLITINSSQTTSYGTISNNTGSAMILSIKITPSIVGRDGKKWDMHIIINSKDFHFKYRSYAAVTYTGLILASGASWQIYAYYDSFKTHDGTEIHFAYSITITSPSPTRTLTDGAATPLYMQIIC
jgi:hypothetical protein